MSQSKLVQAPGRPDVSPFAEQPDGIAVAHLAAEFWPFARTGGLAEAVRGIARFQAADGIPTFVFMPLYRKVRIEHPEIEPVGDSFSFNVGGREESGRLYRLQDEAAGFTVYFVDHAGGYFDRDGIYGEGQDYPDNPRRFAFFCLAALMALPKIWSGPLVLHPHDWHTALTPVFLRTLLRGRAYYDRAACVLSVHNAGYQGVYSRELIKDLGLPEALLDWRYMEWHGRANLLKGGLVFADCATTVSQTHAHELRTRAGGFGLHDTFVSLVDRFIGIRNGIDLEIWDPSVDPDIEQPYSAEDLTGKAACKVWLQNSLGLAPEPKTPVFGMTARLVEQKGLDLILSSHLLFHVDAQFIFLGQGERRYEDALRRLSERAPDKIQAYFDFTEEREHKLLAGADLLLMPSQYEPCGLTQMRAQRYGALPVARRVGGLADTIRDQVTGFLFDEYTTQGFEEAVQRALMAWQDPESWREHIVEAMAQDFGWRSSVQEYLRVYRKALRQRAGLGVGAS